MLSEKELLASREERRLKNKQIALDAFRDTFDSLVWEHINQGESHVVAPWEKLGFAGKDPEACWDAAKESFVSELIDLGYEVGYAYRNSIFTPSQLPFGLIIAWGEGKLKMPSILEEYESV